MAVLDSDAMGEGHWVIVAPGTAGEWMVPVRARLVVGRECVGVPSEMRLVINDPTVSRNHLELRLEPASGMTLIDLSTNGTWVGGTRAPRMRPIPIRDQAMIELGKTRLQYRLTEGRAGLELLERTMTAAGAGRLTIAGRDALAGLTDRQLEILALVAQGHSNAGIAERLMVSRRTVEAHLHNIMNQLGLPEVEAANRRVHAVLAYLRAHSAAAADEEDEQASA